MNENTCLYHLVHELKHNTAVFLIRTQNAKQNDHTVSDCQNFYTQHNF